LDSNNNPTPKGVEKALSLPIELVSTTKIDSDTIEQYRGNSTANDITYRFYFRNGKLSRYTTVITLPGYKEPAWWPWPEKIRHYGLIVCWPLWLMAIAGALCDRNYRRVFAQWALAIALLASA